MATEQECVNYELVRARVTRTGAVQATVNERLRVTLFRLQKATSFDWLLPALVACLLADLYRSAK